MDHKKTYGGGGGQAKYKKNFRARENEMKKNSCTPINPKKYSCYGLKNTHTRNLITKKIPVSQKFPIPPPHNFCNGPSLTRKFSVFTVSPSKIKKTQTIQCRSAESGKWKSINTRYAKSLAKKIRSVRYFIALNARYSGKSFTQIYKALYGNAMLVSL